MGKKNEIGKIEKNGYLIYPKGVWEELKYHNEQIYLNFSFFIKVTLAIAGGMTLLMLNNGSANTTIKSNLLQVGLYIETTFAVYTIIVIWLHVRSKRARYHKNKVKNTFSKLLGSGETWMTVLIMLITCIMWWQIK